MTGTTPLFPTPRRHNLALSPTHSNQGYVAGLSKTHLSLWFSGNRCENESIEWLQRQSKNGFSFSIEQSQTLTLFLDQCQHHQIPGNLQLLSG